MTVSVLDRKLVRDLWRLRGQVLAVALVVGSGVAVMVMSLTSIEALDETAAAYYERYRFAEVFAEVKRAPNTLLKRIADIDGVRTVETRITEVATLDVAGFAEPVIGRLVSLSARDAPQLNRLVLRAGRLAEPDHPNEAVLNEPFADEHGLAPGDRLAATINGHRRTLEIVGIVLSPEYVYAIGPGQLMPDEARYGVVWMGRQALEAALDMEGAFNDVALELLRGAAAPTVIAALDRLLDRYGGIGAYARADQISNWFLMNEIRQLRSMAHILPTVFLMVAAFLTNMVMARLIATERSEIGLMKAFGYADREVGWHYAKMVLVMAGLGVLIGWAVGAWLGRVNTALYAEFFRFPFLLFRPGPTPFTVAALISLGAALVGGLGAVRGAVALPPAEAMRPPAPPLFHRSRLAASGWAGRWLDQPTRIVLRQLARWPLRALLTTTGLAMAVAVLVSSLQWLDAIDRIVEVYFHDNQRQDLTVGLIDPRSAEAVRGFARLPGVLAVEPGRSVGAILQAGNRRHRGAVTGLVAAPALTPLRDAGGSVVRLPSDGLVLSTELAAKLGVGRGDAVRVRLLEGRRPTVAVPVAAVFETYIGMPAYMNLGALQRLLREGPRVEYAHLLVDRNREAALFAELKELPAVAAVSLRRAAVDTFHETMAETLLIFISFFVAFSCTLAVGVAYNSARIALSERGRDLATLRVLGFGRAEIAYILLGELALLVFAAVPLGWLAGYGLAWTITESFATELFRVPLAIAPATYGWSAMIGVSAAFASGWLVRRRLDRLDLIAVLKTRE